LTWRGAAAPLVCVALVPATAAAAPSLPLEIPPRQAVAFLLVTHDVHGVPRATSPVTTVVQARRPITGTRTVLPVIARAVDARGRPWLKVRLPGRTLGHRTPPATGWIPETRLAGFRWRLVVDLSARQVLAYHDGRLQRSYGATVGKPSTPTPVGTFFVEENVRLRATRPGAPFALALSARSSVLQEFDGGPGQIAIHGRDNVGGRSGTASSHGCVRLATKAITWLADRIPAGTPVDIDP
jgi:lipoprotein-anchoring transpeptidase ErfK/SrfK